MEKYRSIPVEIEAIQYTRGKDLEIIRFGTFRGFQIRHWSAHPEILVVPVEYYKVRDQGIQIPQPSQHLSIGDWLIWDAKIQSFSVMSEVVFDCTYEKVTG